MNQNSLTTATNQDKVQSDLEWLMRLPALPSDTELAKVDEVEKRLLIAADPVWTLGRVASLLTPYYERDVPQGVREMEAEDWLEAIGQFPQWAIDRAVKWWKSADNQNRRKRPLEGDIAAICANEVARVRYAAMRARRANEGDADAIGPTGQTAFLRKWEAMRRGNA